MAVNRVEALLRQVSRTLLEAGIPYAVVGGNAVAAWVATVDEGAVRATKDVDILLRRQDLSGAAEALRGVNLMSAEVLGVTMFVDRDDPNPRTGVHVVIADELVRPHYAHPAPSSDRGVEAAGGFFVMDLAGLLTMKLQAFRDVDRVHVRDMLGVGLISDSVVSSLPDDLRGRLDEIRATQE